MLREASIRAGDSIRAEASNKAGASIGAEASIERVCLGRLLIDQRPLIKQGLLLEQKLLSNGYA